MKIYAWTLALMWVLAIGTMVAHHTLKKQQEKEGNK